MSATSRWGRELDTRARHLDPAEASFFEGLQEVLSTSRKKRLPGKITRICAVDAAYAGDKVVAVATLFIGPRMAEQSVYAGYCTFPYVSGLFFVREGPPAVEAVRRLQTRPQLVCFDAHGAAHPRSAGLATICGLILRTPSIGIAKSLLVGTVEGEGSYQTIEYRGERVGYVSRINGSARYWSTGYSVSTKELKLLMDEHGHTCLEAMAKSDLDARTKIESADRHNGTNSP